MAGNYYFLALAWILWCTLHSLLISRTISRRMQSLLGRYQFHFRLLFNLTACLTLLPLIVATAAMRGEVMFAWKGPWVVLQFALIGLSLWLFRDGAKHYDMGYMLGTKQVRCRQQHLLLAAEEHFSRKGSLGITRHPWYLGSLLFLWAILPLYHQSSVIAAAVLSIYLIIGTWLEERKILAEYGNTYRSYQREVSMLLPWKWLVKKIKGEH